MLESDDIHLCRCNASSDNRKVSIIYCVSRNIIPNIGRDKSLADDLNMLRGIVSRGVVFALRPAEIRPSYHRFVRTDISPPTYHTTSHTLQTNPPHRDTPRSHRDTLDPQTHLPAHNIRVTHRSPRPHAALLSAIPREPTSSLCVPPAVPSAARTRTQGPEHPGPPSHETPDAFSLFPVTSAVWFGP